MGRARTRDKSLGFYAGGPVLTRFHQPGGQYLPWGPVAASARRGSSGFIQTTDVVGNLKGDNPFYSERREIHPARLSGTITSPSVNYGYQYRHQNSVVGPEGLYDTRLNHAFGGSPDQYVNTVLGRKNPNRPDVDLLNFIWELRDLVSLLHHAVNSPGFRPTRRPNRPGSNVGRNGDANRLRGLTLNQLKGSKTTIGSIVENLGSAPIQHVFGWAPLLSDLGKLLGIADAIDSRLAALSQLKGKVVRESIKIHDKTVTSNPTAWYGISGMPWGYVHRQSRQRVWATKTHTIRVNPMDPPRWNRSDAFHLAFNDDPTITLWNSLPWSWLFDYFVDVGGFLAATGNRIKGYAVLSLNIMQEDDTTLTSTFQGLNPEYGYLRWTGTLSHTPLRARHRTRQRYVEYDPSPKFPEIFLMNSSSFRNIGFLAIALMVRR